MKPGIPLTLLLACAGAIAAPDDPGIASTRPVAAACGLRPQDWCAAAPGDGCGAHPDEVACRADPQCRGLPYRGESLVFCQPDGKGFWSNCPAVGCVARSAESTPPRSAN